MVNISKATTVAGRQAFTAWKKLAHLLIALTPLKSPLYLHSDTPSSTNTPLLPSETTRSPSPSPTLVGFPSTTPHSTASSAARVQTIPCRHPRPRQAGSGRRRARFGYRLYVQLLTKMKLMGHSEQVQRRHRKGGSVVRWRELPRQVGELFSIQR